MISYWNSRIVVRPSTILFLSLESLLCGKSPTICTAYSYMYCLTEWHYVTKSMLIVLTACAFIFDKVWLSCSFSRGASKKKTGFSMYSIRLTYVSSSNSDVQSSTMIEIARIEFSIISSYCSAAIAVIYCKFPTYKLSVKNSSRSCHALNPPLTMIIDMTEQTVFLMSLLLS